ncbi:MerR family transcriptional regulator [Bacillus sp. OTU530]|uniref:MerR family transcriptional regulator n=1 Tax=Bacillus sp. OTU530 TaxID=3043862 RepID=UPI00313D2AAC
MLRAVPQEKTYTGSIFAKKLGVNQSTLRNYKAHFVKAGISFTVENKKTVYTEKDLQMFKAMLDLYKQGGQTIAECVHTVLKGVLSVQNDRGQLQDVLKQLEQHETQIEQLQKYIDTKLEQESLLRDAQEKRQEERDRQRDAQLVEVIRGLQEIKAAQEKKSFWQRLKWFFSW